MIYLRQSTASQEVPLGYFLDSTDGNSEETGLTIANTDIKVWKNGATALVNKNSGGAIHMANGIYYTVLDATDTNTAGSLVIFVHVSGALSIKVECLVLTALVYDAMIAGSDNLQVDLAQWLGTAPLALSSQRVQTAVGAMDANVLTAAAIASDAITAAKIAADAIGASELAADAATEIATAVWAATTRILTANTNLNDPTAAAIAGAVWDEAKSGHVAAGSFGEEVQAHALSSEVAALNDLDSTAVQSAAAAALTAYDPPTKAELDAGLAGLNDPDAAAIADAVWDEAIGGHLAAGSTGEALDNAGAAGSPPTAGEIADAVWDEALAGHAGAGSTGEALAGAGSAGDPWATPLPGAYGAGTAGKILGDNLDAAVSSRSDFDPTADTVDVGAVGGTAVSGPAGLGDPYGGYIWLNPLIGAAGTTPYVNGTALNPVDNLYDAMALADTLKIYNIRGTLDFITPAANQPAGSSAIQVFGQAVSFFSAPYTTSRLSFRNCHLYNGNLNNNAAYTRPIYDSVLDTLGNISTSVYNSALVGSSCGIKSGARLYNCNFATTLNCNGSAGFFIYGGRGNVTIATMTGGGGYIFAGDGLTITLAASCTGGTLYVYGNAHVINTGTTTVVRVNTVPTAAGIADAVWDEALVGHAGAGSAGAALAAAGSAGDPWDTAVPGAYAAGTAGYLLGAYLDAAISSRSDFDPGADQVDVGSLATAVAQAIADEVLKRGVANVEDTANTASLAAIILATLESSISGSTWTIRKTAGGTFATKTVTTDAGAEPIVGVD